LARLGAWLRPPAWQPPPAEVRLLQVLNRRNALADALQRERNRQEKCLAVPSIDPKQDRLRFGHCSTWLLSWLKTTTLTSKYFTTDC